MNNTHETLLNSFVIARTTSVANLFCIWLIAELGSVRVFIRVKLVGLSGQGLGYFIKYLLNILAILGRGLRKLHIMTLSERLGDVKRYFATLCQVILVSH